MKITEDIEMIDIALYLKKDNSLVITDTHIGYEEALNKQGILIPRFQFREIIQRLECIFNMISKSRNKRESGESPDSKKSTGHLPPRFKNNKKETNKRLLNRIIINGDIKHEFGTISEQEWRHTSGLLHYLKQYCRELILIRGNHDTILGPIAKKKCVKIKNNFIMGDILITHGDRLDKNISDLIKKNNLKKIIIGHEHPAISLKEGSRVELFKCFLKGRWRNKTLIVQPSFNLVTEGTDVTKEQLLSPFLKQDLSNFDVYAVSDKAYKFGKLNNLFTYKS